MVKNTKNIEDFFSAYETNFNAGLSGENQETQMAISSSFTECFIESSPLGVMCGKNGEEFIANINRGFQFYRTIGSLSMKIISREITPINDLHDMVKVNWRYSFKKEDNEDFIDFENTYFLKTLNNQTKIFAYIAGDEQKALKEKGLLPEQ